MLLGIRTDTGVAELYLYDANGSVVANTTWEADRTLARYLLKKLINFLEENGVVLDQLSGLFVFRGPGSYTGLRIGLTVMNTLAYAQNIPIVGADGDDWLAVALERLRCGENDQVVVPFYGGEARITQPKK